MTKNVPNIFDYATKELSQDAVICWLVSCAKEATDDLRKCGLSFVEALLHTGDGRVIDPQTGDRYMLRNGAVAEIVIAPKTQYLNIDIFFQVKWADELVSVIVEDKTEGQIHGNQLERYVTEIRGDKLEEHFIKAIYFKTGYLFEDERENVEKSGYCVFDIDEIINLFQDCKLLKAHEFVCQFAQYVQRKKSNQRKAIQNWDLDKDFVQWEFMTALKNELNLGEKWPARSFNIGGGAWTQYPHYEDRRELFWRLDSWKPLRLMVDTTNIKDSIDNVLDSWDDWEFEFGNCAKQCGLKSIPLSRKVRTRNGSVVSEGTIGQIDVSSFLRKEGLEKCVERICKLHRLFSDSVNMQPN